MKVTVRKFDDKGNIVLESHDLRVADYITPKDGLFDMMQLVSEIIETKIKEPCEFVISDYRRNDDLISRAEAIDAIDVLKRNYPSSCFEELCKAVDIAIKALSVHPEQLTDSEKRIFLAAMGREEKVCKEVDAGEPYEDSLVRVCHEIIRKVKAALWEI